MVLLLGWTFLLFRNKEFIVWVSHLQNEKLYQVVDNRYHWSVFWSIVLNRYIFPFCGDHTIHSWVLQMFLGHIKSEEVYLVVERRKNQRKIMSHNFHSINKPICWIIDVSQAFEAEISIELFISNCVFLQKCTKWSAPYFRQSSVQMRGPPQL